ncbi:hypothetical protein FRA28_05320, partial [Escherichia coli]
GVAGVFRGKKGRTTISREAGAAGGRGNRQFVGERTDQRGGGGFFFYVKPRIAYFDRTFGGVASLVGRKNKAISKKPPLEN